MHAESFVSTSLFQLVNDSHNTERQIIYTLCFLIDDNENWLMKVEHDIKLD